MCAGVSSAFSRRSARYNGLGRQMRYTSRTWSGISIHGSAETSCAMIACGNRGARSAGPIGCRVAGCRYGAGGAGISGRMLYQRSGMSPSLSRIFLVTAPSLLKPSEGACSERVALAGGPESLELRVRELDFWRRHVLLKMLERQRARDRKHPRRAPKEPREHDLRRGRGVPPGDLAKGGATAPAQRKERNEHDSFACAVVDDRVVLPLREVVLVLHRGNWHDLAGPLDLFDPDLGDADMADPAAVPVFLDRPEALLERSRGVDPVQVVKGDAVCPQPAKTLLHLGAQHLWTTASGAAEAAPSWRRRSHPGSETEPRRSSPRFARLCTSGRCRSSARRPRPRS